MNLSYNDQKVGRQIRRFFCQLVLLNAIGRRARRYAARRWAISPVCFGALLAGLSGCAFHSAPQENRPFTELTSLAAMNGFYQNEGRTGDDQMPLYLSQVVLPDVELDTQTIRAVRLIARNDDMLEAAACGANGVLATRALHKDTDFQQSGGRLNIERRWFFSGFKAGEFFVGPAHGSQTLGLDTAGRAKYASRISAAGLLFALMPFAMTDKTETYFPRLDSRVVGNACAFSDEPTRSVSAQRPARPSPVAAGF